MRTNLKDSNLTEEQQDLLANWDDLSRKDRKVLNQLISHMLSISLERRVRKEWMEANGIVDHVKRRPAASA